MYEIVMHIICVTYSESGSFLAYQQSFFSPVQNIPLGSWSRCLLKLLKELREENVVFPCCESTMSVLFKNSHKVPQTLPKLGMNSFCEYVCPINNGMNEISNNTATSHEQASSHHIIVVKILFLKPRASMIKSYITSQSKKQRNNWEKEMEKVGRRGRGTEKKSVFPLTWYRCVPAQVRYCQCDNVRNGGFNGWLGS